MRDVGRGEAGVASSSKGDDGNVGVETALCFGDWEVGDAGGLQEAVACLKGGGVETAREMLLSGPAENAIIQQSGSLLCECQ